MTNLGVQWFCTGTYNPDHLYHQHGGQESNKPDNRQFMLKNTGSRIGFQPTPILQIGQPISSRPVVKGEILKSLKRANFTGTSVDSKALELLLSHCKNLQKMIMDDEVWNNFFNLFEIDKNVWFFICLKSTRTQGFSTFFFLKSTKNVCFFQLF